MLECKDGYVASYLLNAMAKVSQMDPANLQDIVNGLHLFRAPSTHPPAPMSYFVCNLEITRLS